MALPAENGGQHRHGILLVVDHQDAQRTRHRAGFAVRGAETDAGGTGHEMQR
jgi:hypothetical protein